MRSSVSSRVHVLFRSCWAPAGILALIVHGVAWVTSVPAAEVVDLRDGARTSFYGGFNFGETPPQGDAYGWALAFGDLDGDGFLDFFSSSANAEGPNDEHDHEKDVYLFFGRPRAEFDSLYAVDDPGVADIVFYEGGFAMACADLDHDGYDDAILSQPTATDASGRGLYIIFGAPRSQLRRVYDFKADHYDYTPPDVFITGLPYLGGAIIDVTGGGYDLVSQSLVSGDFNADGYADIAFGSHWARGPFGGRVVGGAAYIVFGRPRHAFPPVIDVDLSSALPRPDVAIYGEAYDRYPVHAGRRRPGRGRC